MVAKALDHKVQVYVSDGTVIHFTSREMRELYLSWPLWMLILVGFFVISTGHPVTLPQFENLGLRIVFWWLALSFYMLTSDRYAKFIERIWLRLVGRAIPLILLSAPLVLASTYASAAVLSTLFEPHSGPFCIITWQMNVRNVLVAHAFETLALLWLIPAQRARKQQQHGHRLVTLAGRKFKLNDIVRVKAAEHHLEVHSETGSEVIRERMSTFLEQVTPEDGIQTHRSHWVAQSTVDNLSGANLRLTSGMKIPVARGRLEDVRDWIDAHPRPKTMA